MCVPELILLPPHRHHPSTSTSTSTSHQSILGIRALPSHSDILPHHHHRAPLPPRMIYRSPSHHSRHRGTSSRASPAREWTRGFEAAEQVQKTAQEVKRELEVKVEEAVKKAAVVSSASAPVPVPAPAPAPPVPTPAPAPAPAPTPPARQAPLNQTYIRLPTRFSHSYAHRSRNRRSSPSSSISSLSTRSFRAVRRRVGDLWERVGGLERWRDGRVRDEEREREWRERLRERLREGWRESERERERERERLREGVRRGWVGEREWGVRRGRW